LKKETYFRHLFIFISQNQTFSENITAQLCSIIKNGDFIAFLHSKHLDCSQELDWFEQTAFGSDRLRHRAIESVLASQLIPALPLLGRQAAAYSNPFLLNVLADQPADVPRIKEAVSRLRVEGLFPFHVNFFADFTHNDISTATGFNEIHASEDSQS
jgi:hypothetical protein